MGPIRFRGDEFAFIDWIRRQTQAGKGLLVGPGDDACVLKASPGGRICVTTDMLLEGTHFSLTEVTPAEVGWKAVGVSLSDIAAMGMEPVVLVAAVGLHEGCGRALTEELYRGMKMLADRFGVPIAGGDVTSWDAARTVTCVTAIGQGAEPVLRSGARPGDVIVVTGELGGSILGRHVQFVPRLPEAAAIVRDYSPHAMIDISDGLSSDLAHIAVESGVGAVIEESCLPISQDAKAASVRDDRSTLDHALNDGEDFELLVTLSEADAVRLLKDKPFETRLTVVGRIVKGDGLLIRASDGGETTLEPGGYEHLHGR